MKPSRKKWVTFGWLFLINTIVSIALAFFFYWLFGKEIRLYGGPLEIDFFNTVCGIFTIIGLAVAIFQLTDIRAEKQIQEDTRKQIYTANFKRDYLSTFQDTVKEIEELESLMNNADFNKTTFEAFLAKIDFITDCLHKIEIQQVAIQCGVILDCKNCLTLLERLSVDFREIIDTNAYQNFKKFRYIGMVGSLRREGNRCTAEMLKL